MPPKKAKISVKKRKTNDSYAFWDKAANISNDVSKATTIGLILLLTLSKAVTHMVYLSRRRSARIRRNFPDGLLGALRENIEDELSQQIQRR